VTGVSKGHSYNVKSAYEEGDIEALKEQNRCRPNLKNRVSQEVEDTILAFADEFPAYGQFRVANELRQRGLHVSAGGIRSVWLRRDLETFKKRLKRLEAKAALEGIVLTQAHVPSLAQSKLSSSNHISMKSRHFGAVCQEGLSYAPLGDPFRVA